MDSFDKLFLAYGLLFFQKSKERISMVQSFMEDSFIVAYSLCPIFGDSEPKHYDSIGVFENDLPMAAKYNLPIWINYTVNSTGDKITFILYMVSIESYKNTES